MQGGVPSTANNNNIIWGPQDDLPPTVELGENAKSILKGFTDNNIKDTKDESLKERARNKIGYDYLAGRISEEEGDYLSNYFGLN